MVFKTYRLVLDVRGMGSGGNCGWYVQYFWKFPFTVSELYWTMESKTSD